MRNTGLLHPPSPWWLVSFIGWVVLRYNRSYLDGEGREGRFHDLMLATLCAVGLLALREGQIIAARYCPKGGWK